MTHEPMNALRACRQEQENWESRVRELEMQGLTRSDAQAVADAEDQLQTDLNSIVEAVADVVKP